MSDINENWKCSMCGTDNTGNFCCECGSIKPGYVPKNKQTHNVSDSTADPADADGKWRCKVCGTTNTDSKCLFCGQTKSDNGKFVVPQQQVFPNTIPFTYPPGFQPARGLMCNPMPPTQPQNAEPWLCTRCDHTNKGGDYCFNCGMQRSKAADKKEAWTCPDCNNEVGDDAPFCPECGKIDPRLTKEEALKKYGYSDDEIKEMRKPPIVTGVMGSDSIDTNEPKALVSDRVAFGGAVLPEFINLPAGRKYFNPYLKDSISVCGCYSCCKIFESSEITSWNGDLAVCPYCGSDTVVGRPEHEELTVELLEKMNTFHIKGQPVDRCYPPGYIPPELKDIIDKR